MSSVYEDDIGGLTETNWRTKGKFDNAAEILRFWERSFRPHYEHTFARNGSVAKYRHDGWIFTLVSPLTRLIFINNNSGI